MWLASFWSVLDDLARFALGLEQPVPVGHQLFAIDQASGTAPATSNPKPISIDNGLAPAVVLVAGQLYDSQSTITIVIRKTLQISSNDLVQLGNLTNIEWLMYSAHIQNVSVPLALMKITPLGLWYTTLKGKPDIQIGIEPRTGTLAEWTMSNGSNQAGLVTRVSPDNTITIQSISATPSGTCVEEILSADVWIERRPIFTRWRS